MNVHTQIYKQQKRAIRESRNPSHSKRFINLSPGQLDILNCALHELAEAGSDTSGCVISEEDLDVGQEYTWSEGENIIDYPDLRP